MIAYIGRENSMPWLNFRNIFKIMESVNKKTLSNKTGKENYETADSP